MAGMVMTSTILANIITPILTTIGVFVAAFSIWQSNNSAKKRATIDMLMAERNNALLQDAITEVNELAKKDNNIFAVYVSEDESHKKKQTAHYKTVEPARICIGGCAKWGVARANVQRL